ncbi:MAG: hypothetical protein KTR15_00695 [Phycisphaeraceae bacterium]|nr:hypothetical protein [Phycisphaeraceae bacterium]
MLCAVAGTLPALIATGAIAIGLYDAFILTMLWMYAAIPFLILLIVWRGCLHACEYKPGRRARWIGALLIIFNLSLFTEWPIYASFYLHRPALNDLVERHQAGDMISLPAQVGLFRVYDIETVYWGYEQDEIIDLTISSNTGSPDHLVYGMGDERVGRAATPFNIWSDRRLDKDWHIVHED